MLDFHVLDCSRTRLYYRDSRMCLWMFLNIEKNVPEPKMCSEFVQSFVTCFEILLWIKISRMNSMGEMHGRNSVERIWWEEFLSSVSTVQNRTVPDWTKPEWNRAEQNLWNPGSDRARTDTKWRVKPDRTGTRIKLKAKNWKLEPGRTRSKRKLKLSDQSGPIGSRTSLSVDHWWF